MSRRKRTSHGGRYTPPQHDPQPRLGSPALQPSDLRRVTSPHEAFVPVPAGCSPASRPLVALSWLMLGTAAEEQHHAGICVDVCRTMDHALAYYGSHRSLLV